MGEEHRLFELVGEAPVYAVGLPEARTRAEPKIDTAGRRQDSAAVLRPGDVPAGARSTCSAAGT